ncbi:MAG: DUF4160 domain-containing protein [Anaerolineae bacterium]
MDILLRYRDHPPAHFHVRYAGEVVALVGIGEIVVLEGELPPGIRHKVLAWAALHQAELRADWELARAGLPLHRIAPLD